ncbi:unnamed protein product [Ambrosiozyma monospora]|uniref:Unnamed protein product n=1 Tax=Ambrosiozyma monospora TaxID=43982 RepID=A0A9W6YRT0_AMBMO|nr:unnamed protein product [Ambrosiozyma monospora]
MADQMGIDGEQLEHTMKAIEKQLKEKDLEPIAEKKRKKFPCLKSAIDSEDWKKFDSIPEFDISELDPEVMDQLLDQLMEDMITYESNHKLSYRLRRLYDGLRCFWAIMTLFRLSYC